MSENHQIPFASRDNNICCFSRLDISSVCCNDLKSVIGNGDINGTVHDRIADDPKPATAISIFLFTLGTTKTIFCFLIFICSCWPTFEKTSLEHYVNVQI